MKIRRLLRILHRDFGYFITGIVLIYSISGIALNHRKDWNPHHIVVQEELYLKKQIKNLQSEVEVKEMIGRFKYQPIYKKHFVTEDGVLKVFVENGMVVYSPMLGEAKMEILEKRPFFYHINKLHLAGTKRAWVWIADGMSIILILVTVSGLFLLKGKNGITGRGLWLTLLGFAIPGFFLLFYF